MSCLGRRACKCILQNRNGGALCVADPRAEVQGFQQAATSGCARPVRPKQSPVPCAREGRAVWHRLAYTAWPSSHPADLANLRSAALDPVELLENFRGLRGDGIGDTLDHFLRLFHCRGLRVAIPSGWRNRTHIGQHWLKAARAPQRIDLVAVVVVGRIINAIQVHKVRTIGQHRQRFDFPRA